MHNSAQFTVLRKISLRKISQVMKNPFKFGSIVENEFFTDRISELCFFEQKLNSENHIILISPCAVIVKKALTLQPS